MLHFVSAFVLITIARSVLIENNHCPYFGPAASIDSPFVNGERVNLTDAMNNNGAACLDGTVPVFYWRKGSGSGINKFHVYFEGGGWCGGINEQLSPCQDTCIHRTTTDLGSSKAYPASANYDSGYMSTNPSTNPLAHNWNTVYVKYCDGASFSGNNDTTETSGSTTLHWRGWRILNGVFALLNSKYDWSSATDVLISGCSAGGLTTWLHSQHIYDTYVKTLTTNPSFLSMPDSGFFLEWEGSGKYITAMQWTYSYQETHDALNKECLSSNTDNPWKCMFAQETASYENFKMFPLQSRFDSWQAGCELQSTDTQLLNGYGANLTSNFENLYINGGASKAMHAGFLDSCYHHCGEWNAFAIDGMTASQAQFEFYYGNNTHDKFWFQNDAYPCAKCCNQK